MNIVESVQIVVVVAGPKQKEKLNDGMVTFGLRRLRVCCGLLRFRITLVCHYRMALFALLKCTSQGVL